MMSFSPPVLLPRLGVNVDHVATVRQARRASYPDPVHAAVLAELGGAAQITVHLREDRRHIQDRDVELLRRTITTRLNLEMAATPEMVRIAQHLKPDMVTLVPEKRTEVTTEGGLDVIGHEADLAATVAALRSASLTVSLFIDPDEDQVRKSLAIGAHAVELHTGRFCDAHDAATRAHEHRRLVTSAHAAVAQGLRCYAGHGIHYDNVGAIASILDIEELNIGHSIVGRALMVGMERAVRDMRDLAWQARRDAVAAARP